MTSFGKLGNQISRLIIITCIVVGAYIAGAGGCAAQSAGDATQRFDLRIENGRLTGNLKTLQVRHNDIVEINWFADRRTVLHLHGYDIETTVDAGLTKTMLFRARATGRFPIETHSGRHAVLLYLEVHPR
jgi:hypothetical protein